MGVPANDNMRARTLQAVAGSANRRLDLLKAGATVGRMLSWGVLAVGIINLLPNDFLPITEADAEEGWWKFRPSGGGFSLPSPMTNRQRESITSPLEVALENNVSPSERRYAATTIFAQGGPTTVWGSTPKAVLGAWLWIANNGRKIHENNEDATVSLLGCGASGSTDTTCAIQYNSFTRSNGAPVAEQVLEMRVRLSLGYVASQGHSKCEDGQAWGTSCMNVDFENPPPVFRIAPSYSAEVPMNRGAQWLHPEFVRRLTDDLWKDAAAQPGYDGIPYPLGDPVTQADVDLARQQMANQWPNATDLNSRPSPDSVAGNVGSPITIPWNATTPAGSPGHVPDSGVQPGATVGPQPNPQPGTGGAVDLGPNPNIGPPNLNTPSAASIIEPLFSIFQIDQLQVPSGGQCPTDSFQMWGETFTLDKHCDLFEQYRSTISAIFLLVWPLTALVIVMRA